MKSKILFSFLLVLTMSHVNAQEKTVPVEKGMVKVAILYPNEEGETFDMEYYANKHMPLVADLFGNLLKHYAVDKGVSGRTPEDSAPYVAIGYLYFNKLSDYQNAFKVNGEKILSDIPNYTNIKPVVQISEIIQN
nr:EthD family reductase [uncultured Allomuricauda sp.]